MTMESSCAGVDSMTPEQLFHTLLGLGDEWRVTRCEYQQGDKSGTVSLSVEETPQLWPAESARAKESVVGYDHTEDLVWRHLNVFEHRCEIHCRLPRGRKVKSGQVYRVRPPWEGLSKHFTTAFETMALLLMRQMPVSAVARHIGETDTRLWRMLKAHVAAAHPRVDWSGVVCVGCDEMSVRKGHCYISVFCDLIGKRVLFAVPGKDSAVWEGFVEELGRHNGHPRAITEVSIDMSVAYTAGVRENLGDQAAIVYDKFHVIAHVNKAVDEARRAERRICGKADSELLKRSRWLLLKNTANHTPEEKLRYRGLLNSNLAAVKAHQMRLAIQDIYEMECSDAARRKLRAWCRWVRWIAGKNLRPLFWEMVKCANMIERHLDGILAHWARRTTNAFLEGLNSVFSAVKRKARGFRSVDNLVTMLYFTAGRLDIPATH